MTADKPRRKYTITDAERARRAAQIRPHGPAAREKARTSQTYEQRVANIRKAIAKRLDNARRFKEMQITETVESIRDARKQVEAKAAEFRDKFARKPRDGGERMDPAAAAVILKDYRAEIAQLWARERCLSRSEGGDSGPQAATRPDAVSAQSPALAPLDPDSAVED